MRTQNLVRWLIVVGSGANVGAAFLSCALATAYAEKLAEQTHVPVEAIMIDHRHTQSGNTLQPGELVITRKPDGTMRADYVAQTPTVTKWEAQ